MPSIKRNEQQEEALAKVTENLGILSALSDITGDRLKSAVITLDKGGKGKKSAVKITLLPEDKEMRRLQGIIDEYRKRIIRDIRECARKFDIDLDAKEAALLDGKFEAEPANVEEPQAGPVMEPEPQQEPGPMPEGQAATEEPYAGDGFSADNDDEDADLMSMRGRFEDDF